MTKYTGHRDSLMIPLFCDICDQRDVDRCLGCMRDALAHGYSIPRDFNTTFNLEHSMRL